MEVKRFRADWRHVVETEFDDAQYVGVKDFDRILAERDALQQRLNELGEQHQGEPVALPARRPDLSVLLGKSHDPFMKGQDIGWNACLDEIAKLGPLYTHADPGEVERLRERMLACEEIAENNAKACAEALTKLAEAHALLREVLAGLWPSTPMAIKINAALSASAEPSAPVTLCASEIGFHAETGVCDSQAIISRIKELGITYFRFMPDRFGDCLWFFNCRNVPADLPEWVEVKAVTAKDWVGRGGMTEDIAKEIEADTGKDDGAPVEIDELPGFEKWWSEHGEFCRAGGGDYEKTFAWRAWEYRAALNRK